LKIKTLLPLFVLALLFSILIPFKEAKGQKTIQIRFAFQDRIGSVIPIMTANKGFFAQQNLNIKALRFSSGPACAEALYSGAADIGAMGDTTAVITVSRSDKFKIIASHATGEHRHRVMVRKDSKLKTLKDLKGKRLGVKKGTSTYGGLLAALKTSGIAPQKIRIIDLTPPTMTDALLAGSIDAFVASEPTPSVAEEKGARELTTLGGLDNEYPILILANKKILHAHPQAVKRFVQALQQAEDYAAKHSKETAQIMAQETGLKLSTTKRAMQSHEYRLRLDKPILNSLQKSADFLKAEDIISEIPEFKEVVQEEFLK
jgi:sulfonate transport system substrate-binding protein